MSSQLEIINVALVRLRANTIQSLTDGSNEAVSATVLWDITRRAVLGLHTWNFALKEVELAQTNGQFSIEYKYCYTLPADLIRLVKVNGNLDFHPIGNQLQTNQPSCNIKYVFDQTDTAAWTPSFADLFSARLAMELAYPVTANQSSANQAQAIYEQRLKESRFIDSTQDTAEPFSQGANSLISVRF